MRAMTTPLCTRVNRGGGLRPGWLSRAASPTGSTAPVAFPPLLEASLSRGERGSWAHGGRGRVPGSGTVEVIGKANSIINSSKNNSARVRSPGGFCTQWGLDKEPLVSCGGQCWLWGRTRLQLVSWALRSSEESLSLPGLHQQNVPPRRDLMGDSLILEVFGVMLIPPGCRARSSVPLRQLH